MDSTDIALSLMLLSNSRTPYRVLAEKMGLSTNAVHKRIQSLVEQGVIRGFVARRGLAATGVLAVLVHGTTDKAPEGMLTDLSNHGSVYWLSAASGGYVYVGLYLRNLQELGPALEYVQVKTGIRDPKVSMISDVPKFGDPLDDLDSEIIRSLSNDSRKPVADIASELSSSVKTVRRRLEAMVRNQTIDLTLLWYPDVTNDIISLTHVRTREGQRMDWNVVNREYYPNLLFVYYLLNAPRELLCFTWCSSMKEMRTLVEKLRADQRVESATPNILYTGWIFPTWRDVCGGNDASGLQRGPETSS